MADIVLMNVVHGDKDGNRIELKAGDPVSNLSAEVKAELKKAKVIGPEPVAGSEAMSEIEELKAKLAAAEAALAAAPKVETPKTEPVKP